MIVLQKNCFVKIKKNKDSYFLERADVKRDRKFLISLFDVLF